MRFTENAGKVKPVFVISSEQPFEPKSDVVALILLELTNYVRKTCGCGQHWRPFFSDCFDVLTVQFAANRRVGYYVIRICFPSILCAQCYHGWLSGWTCTVETSETFFALLESVLVYKASGKQTTRKVTPNKEKINLKKR